MRKFQQIERQREQKARRFGGICAAVLIFGVAAALVFGAFGGRSARNLNLKPPISVSSESQSLESQGSPAGANASSYLPGSQVKQRPLFPYSVVPGGVESAQELKNAMAHDPVVAGHYADFDVAKARVVRLDQDRMEYVSYRLGDRVYWTNRKLKLLKGESVLTDGKHEARTRCGNQLSETAQAPVSPKQPSVEAMEAENPELVPPTELPPAPLFAPVFPSAAGTGATPGPVTPAAGPPGGGVIPPGFFPPVGGGGTLGSNGPLPPPPPPPVSIPEPGTVELLAAGLGALYFFSARIRNRRKND
jgi:hypothetical protein